MANKHVLILGGDLRQYYMAKFLIQENFAISYFGNLFEKNEANIHKIQSVEKLKEDLTQKKYAAAILPMPVGEPFIKGTDGSVACEELSEWLKAQKNMVVFGGRLEKNFVEKVQKGGNCVSDFLQEESVAIFNAGLTAENAVIEAILLSDNCVRNEKTLIVGYGRCGRMLADLLHGMKANVTVAEPDKEKSALAISYGYKVELLKDLSPYQFVFQTAPVENVLSDKLLSTCLKNERSMETTVLDITSIDNSVNYEYARKHNILVRKCNALPGKYTARSAGKLLAEFITESLKKNEKEEGVEV